MLNMPHQRLGPMPGVGLSRGASKDDRPGPSPFEARHSASNVRFRGGKADMTYRSANVCF
jgi:hypothetical protein